MKAPTEPVAFAWEPLSPRGVAAFAHADWGRLLLVQFIVAVLTATTITWFLISGCLPILQTAIRQLPAQGAIR
ncbi:MAG TPA: hypothetical protein VKA67_06860, partial [Verrucomicrobiae bacterium]|nr:hypothetical protein [Verrucomicrobiae bacterium]